jgi:biotin carboxyl carrier protein
VALSGVLVIALPAAVGMVPVPGTIVLPGVMEKDEDRIVYAQTSGFLLPPQVVDGQRVEQGETLCRLENIVTRCRVEQARAETDVARLRYAHSSGQTPQAAATAQLRLIHTIEKEAHVRQQCDRLTITAPDSGVVTRIVDTRESGRFIAEGEAVATVAAGKWAVRCLATAEEVAGIKPYVGQQVTVRIVADGVQQSGGTVARVAVKGTRHVFSPSLTHLGGGDIAVAPDSLEAKSPLFEVEVTVHEPEKLPLRYGTRASVSFGTEPQTYGAYFYRRFGQFLNRLRVQ